MKDTDIAWAAGFIDGEGYFGYHASGRKYRVELIVSQAAQAPLIKLKDLFGGKILEHTNKNLIWTWRISGAQKLTQVVEQLLPYLVLKRDEAQIFLEACSLINVKGGRVHLTDEHIKQRNDLHTQILQIRKIRRAECLL